MEIINDSSHWHSPIKIHDTRRFVDAISSTFGECDECISFSKSDWKVWLRISGCAVTVRGRCVSCGDEGHELGDIGHPKNGYS